MEMKNVWCLSEISTKEIDQVKQAGIKIHVEEETADISDFSGRLDTIVLSISIRLYTYTDQQDLFLRLMFGERLMVL